MGLAAQMSFYFVLALFPFLIVLAALVGTLPFTNLWERILNWLVLYLPQGVQVFVFETVIGLTRGRGHFLSIGLLGTAWAATGGLMNMMYSLNVLYEVKETRSFFHRLGLALGMIFVLSLFFLGAFTLLALGEWLDLRIAIALGLGDASLDAWKIGRLLLSLGLIAIGTSLLDSRLPNVRRSGSWFTAGTGIALLLWIPVTVLFDLYVRYLSTFGTTYGALAVFVILMIWMYVVSLLVLIAAAINSEIRKERIALSQKTDAQPASLSVPEAPGTSPGPSRLSA